MNKYQKRKSREIKALVRRDKWGRLSYKYAKKVWQFGKRLQLHTPCEDCDTLGCRKIGKPIVYCPERR
jgi:hypothetical protein